LGADQGEKACAKTQDNGHENLNYRDTEKLEAKRRLICLSSSSTTSDDEAAMTAVTVQRQN
jgi:hypothetical protein